MPTLEVFFDCSSPWSYLAFHNIQPVRETHGAPSVTVDVVGPVCESGDFFAKDRALPPLKQGDLVAVMTAGAYGAVQAGTYNTRALIPEVLVHNGEWALVRPRLEADQLIGLDRMPAWL